MTVALERPGIRVRRVQQTTSPTIVTPQLLPNIVAPCFQILDLIKDGAANPDAVMTLPAIIQGTTYVETLDVGGKDFVMRVSGGAKQKVTFPSNATSAGISYIADYINAHTSGFLASAVADPDELTKSTLKFTSDARGAGVSLKIDTDTDAVFAGLGLVEDTAYYGSGAYLNKRIEADFLALPDPRNNIAQLSFSTLEDEIRAFRFQGGAWKEFLRTQSYLRGYKQPYAGNVPTDETKFPVSLLAMPSGADAYTDKVYVGKLAMREVLQRVDITLVAGDELTLDEVPTGVPTEQYPILNTAHDDYYAGYTIVATRPNGTGVETVTDTISAYTAVDKKATVGDGALWTDVTGANDWTIWLYLSSATSKLGIKARPKYAGGTGDQGGSKILIKFDAPAEGSPPEVLEVDVDVVAGTTTIRITVRLARSAANDYRVAGNAVDKIAAAINAAASGYVLATAIGTERIVGVDDDFIALSAQGWHRDPLDLSTDSKGYATVVGRDAMAVDMSGINDKTLTLQFNGGEVIPIKFTGITNPASVVTAINTAVPGSWVPASAPGSVLTLTANGASPDRKGVESTIKIGASDNALVQALFGSATKPVMMTDFVRTHFGAPQPVVIGDEVWVDGDKLATVVAIEDMTVAPLTGNAAKTWTGAMLTLDVTVPRNYEQAKWYIVAKNLALDDDGEWPEASPTPDLVVTTALQTFTIKHCAARTVDGDIIESASFPLYAIYKALRRDVSSAQAGSLLSYSSGTQEELEDDLGPLTPDNPLAYGIYMATQAGPGVVIKGIGIDEVTEDAPHGTMDAYTRAAEFTRAYDVYYTVWDTEDRATRSAIQAHIDAMNEPEAKRERKAIFHLPEPSEEQPTARGSGTASYVSVGVVSFDAENVNVEAVVKDAGVTDLTDKEQFLALGLYVDISSDNKHYLIKEVAGNTVYIYQAGDFDFGENTDGFYTTSGPLAGVMEADGEPASVMQRGAAITNKDDIVQSMADYAAGFNDKYIKVLAPGQCQVSVNGLATLVSGFYACCAYAGLSAKHPPQQSFTEMAIPGLTKVIGSSDKFDETQLAVAAAKGVTWLIQDSPNGAVICRHDLTTDVSTIESREDNIQDVLAFSAKFFRALLRPYIGKYNISGKLLDTISTIVEGSCGYLVSFGVWISVELSSIAQSETQPDTIVLTVSGEPPYPANYIDLTIVI